GTWMQQIAQPWIVLNLSNSAFWVGLDSFAMNAPGLLFTLFGGVLADRYDRKKVILFFQSIQFLCILTMLIFLIIGWLKVWIIVFISFIVGVTDSLSMPSFQSVIPSLVDPKDIPQAVSLNSTQFNLSRFLGPAIAGIVIVRFGVVACFGANAASYIPFFLSLYFIYPRKISKKKMESMNEKPGVQLKEFKKLLLDPGIRLPLMTTFVTNLFCGPLISFCSVLVKNVFHAHVVNFGEAMAAFGLGGLTGAAISFIPLPESLKRNKFATIIAIFLGSIIVGIALNHSFFMLFILLFFAGASITITNISINTFLQENASNNIRGRIASIYQLALSGGIALGALFTGFTVAQLNISAAFVINGIFAVAFQSWFLWSQRNN
ncbi:MAG: MFS transporter, partial [Bacteroidia bacterium]